MAVDTLRQVQYIDQIDDMTQRMMKHMVEKVEMNVAKRKEKRKIEKTKN